VKGRERRGEETLEVQHFGVEKLRTLAKIVIYRILHSHARLRFNAVLKAKVVNVLPKNCEYSISEFQKWRIRTSDFPLISTTFHRYHGSRAGHFELGCINRRLTTSWPASTILQLVDPRSRRKKRIRCTRRHPLEFDARLSHFGTTEKSNQGS